MISAEVAPFRALLQSFNNRPRSSIRVDNGSCLCMDRERDRMYNTRSHDILHFQHTALSNANHDTNYGWKVYGEMEMEEEAEGEGGEEEEKGGREGRARRKGETGDREGRERREGEKGGREGRERREGEKGGREGRERREGEIGGSEEMEEV